MRRRVAWHLLNGAVVLLSVAGISWAGVQGREGVYWLGTGTWQLSETKGGVYLVKSNGERGGGLPRNPACQWHVSAPTIKSDSGKFLASDPAGRDPSVTLSTEKGPNTRWVFEFVSRLQPQHEKGERLLMKGPSGFTFRVKAAEGAFQDWYLAAEEPAPEPENRQGEMASPRPLKLVRDVKEATLFTYIEENYFVK